MSPNVLERMRAVDAALKAKDVEPQLPIPPFGALAVKQPRPAMVGLELA